jgi:hypothetical protein
MTSKHSAATTTHNKRPVTSTEPTFYFTDWFTHNWSRMALPAGLVLICFVPMINAFGGLPLVLLYLHLPAYMIHQYEEHSVGNFKIMINRMLAGGKEKITDTPIFLVNIIGVWVVYLVSINVAALGAIGDGLLMPYSMLINGVLHITTTVKDRRYNPGVLTSIILFVPLSIFTIYTVSQNPETTAGYQLFGIAVAVLLHVFTFGFLKMVARRK